VYHLVFITVVANRAILILYARALVDSRRLQERDFLIPYLNFAIVAGGALRALIL
jgi:hypothetical protein